MPAISVQGLTKSFRTYKKQPGFMGALEGLFHRKYEHTVAVKGVSFSLEEGELVGFLGPNGAGKTTTLKMLAGLLYPTGGSATVLGHIPWERDDGYRRQFALLLGQKNQLWWDLPARESLKLNAKIYGIDAARFERTVSELSELLTVRDPDHKPANLYGTFKYPETYIIDRGGVVRRKFVGPVDWNTPEIVDYLKKVAS